MNRHHQLYSGGYAEECSRCRTSLLTDEEERGTCDDCAERARLGMEPAKMLRPAGGE